MISATGFAASHTSTWKMLAPTTDLYVKRLNASMLTRVFAPLDSVTAPSRRALINEIAFELFSAVMRKETSARLDPIDLENATNAAKALVARMRKVDVEQIDRPSSEELRDSSEQARRLQAFFNANYEKNAICVAPLFSGCGIIDSCVGDVYCSPTLYEIKAGDRLFRSADVRQLLTYAALNKAARGPDIIRLGLFNPRSGNAWVASLDEVCIEVSGGSADELLAEIIRVASSGDTSR